MPDISGNSVEHLSSFSPKDAKFNIHKSLGDQIANLYSLESSDGVKGFMSGEKFVAFDTYAGRIRSCGSWLKFWQTADAVKLIDARFCKVPYCPMCQSRRSLKWRAKFLAALPDIQAKYPSHKWVFLTLTIKNCDLSELRSHVQHMGKSFTRLSQLADYPLVGAIKSLEVTRVWDWYDRTGNFIGRHGTTWYYRSKDPDKLEWTAKPTNEVHPHFHILGLVKASYFTGRCYINQDQWTEMWKQSLRIEYDPIVHIQLVKNKKGKAPIENPNEIENDQSGMIKGICETLKYTVKENDLVGKFCEDDNVNSNWLKTITQELYKLRRVDYGGVLKEFGKEVEKSMEDLIEIEEKEENGMEENGMERIAEWNFHLKAYIMREV
jgi:plasmid rolling circle replication initiator protein Rep